MYPGKTFAIQLALHDGVEPRPAFYVKHMSGKRYRDLVSWLEEFRDSKGIAVHDMVFVKAKELLVGWRNVVHPDTGELATFDGSLVDEVLDFSEALQVIYTAISGNRLSEDDRKKLESQP
jgi:hypothetical protein